jgi:hypothetical protein
MLLLSEGQAGGGWGFYKQISDLPEKKFVFSTAKFQNANVVCSNLAACQVYHITHHFTVYLVYF